MPFACSSATHVKEPAISYFDWFSRASTRLQQLVLQHSPALFSWQSKSEMPPAGYSYGPRYRPSTGIVVLGLLYFLRGKRRSLANDTALLEWKWSRAPLIRGWDNIPETGPLVVVTNHYERPGLWMAWPAIFVGHSLRLRTGRDTHWIAIEEWESFRLAGVHVSRHLIRAVFERVFSIWGILPMARPDASAAARARSMRVATQEIRDGHVIGLMPEGDVGPTPELIEAREGVGAFLLLMAAAGAVVIPMGIYEEDERLVAHAGPAVDLSAPAHLPRTERDHWARDHIMLAIRDLLPPPLWGFYRNRSDVGETNPAGVLH